MSEVTEFMNRACDDYNASIDAGNKGKKEAEWLPNVSVATMILRVLAVDFYIPLMIGEFFSDLTSEHSDVVDACVLRASEFRTVRDTVETIRKEYDERLQGIPTENIPVSEPNTEGETFTLVPFIRKPRSGSDVKVVAADIFG